MKNLSPPSPHFNDEKKARFGLRANSSLIWGEGGFISHFILSKIVVINRQGCFSSLPQNNHSNECCDLIGGLELC